MARYLAQVIILGTQVIGRAFVRAFQQEYAASRVAAQSAGSKSSNRAQAMSNMKHGMTLQEAKDILNVDSLKDPEQVEKAFKHLFDVNDKSKGGSFYIQSKGSPHEFHAIRLSRACYPGRMSVFARQYCSKFHFPGIFTSDYKFECIKRLQNIKSYGYPSGNVQNASVMILMCEFLKKPSIIFTVRSSKMGRNKSDVSFPGGMRDFQDTNSVSAALRETEEEIGISPRLIDVWTVMPSLPTGYGKIWVTPVIGCITEQIHLDECIINPDEVDEVFCRTIESLCDPKNVTYTRFKSKINYTLPAFIGGEHRIWGITAVILHHVLLALCPSVYQGPSVPCTF